MENNSLGALAAVAAGRDHINTSEFANAINKATQTVRKEHCQTGECYGIRPIKLGNSLLWPVAEVVALLTGKRQATSTEEKASTFSRQSGAPSLGGIRKGCEMNDERLTIWASGREVGANK